MDAKKVDAVKSRLLFEITEQAVLDTSKGSSPDEEDFSKLSGPQDSQLQMAPTLPPSPTKWGELVSWLSEKQKNKLLEQTMFLTLSRAAWMMCLLSTTQPYTALQLWRDCSPNFMNSKRPGVTSDNFERLVFMKGNMNLLKMELSPPEYRQAWELTVFRMAQVRRMTAGFYSKVLSGGAAGAATSSATCPRFHFHHVVLRSQLLTLNVATFDLPTLLAAAGLLPGGSIR
ncbi:hypothetical protein GWK47_046007 [Chionoecetes opilio]|uniref:Uncharacterized protein n=1 Tax=Chionoecetes opilio TaxID=41210 RepID=A0A8J4Y6U5_CHIOP|nr:hypothetical protein GWK47_046007 [Chionoecetes opilio]